MTRINVAIPPKNLTDQHLLAEHREIKRLCAMYVKFTDFDKIRLTFCLGTGHMSFFMNKGQYTYHRYIQLHDECLMRGFKVENYGYNWDVYKHAHYNNYVPSDVDKHLIVERITERIMQSKQIPRYYGKIISKEDALNLLNL